MSTWEIVSSLLFSLLYVYMAFRCRKFRLRCEELEKENNDLKSKIDFEY